jgi:anti-sigma factor RsiW
MKCSHVREELPALVYGDLQPEPRDRLREHLTACPACLQELAALERVRGMLDGVPAPEVQVDLARLYREAARRQGDRLRAWRRAAYAVGAAAAAVLLLAIGLNLNVRIESHQVVVRWGTPPAVPKEEPAPERQQVQETVHIETPLPAETVAEMRTLGELVQLLAKDIEARDDRLQLDMARLRATVRDLQRKTSEQWADAQRDISGMYTLQTSQSKKGAIP